MKERDGAKIWLAMDRKRLGEPAPGAPPRPRNSSPPVCIHLKSP